MATATFGSPIKKVYGETVSLTTTAAHLNFMPNYHEVMLYCASAWRMALCPKLVSVKKYVAATAAYTDYTTQATDRLSTTDVLLDSMLVADMLYLGVTDKTRGFYFDMDATEVNAQAASLDWEYCYDISTHGYKRLTGTVSAALTVGETITGGTSGATAVVVYDDGSTYVVIKTIVGSFAIGETASGATQNISAITAITEEQGIGYFTDVAGDSDGTLTGTETLSQDGLYAFTLPAVVRGVITELNSQPLYWYRFKPSATLDASLDVNQIVPAADTTNYAYMEGGVPYQFALNVAQNGSFEFDHTATGTLDISWVRH